MTGAPLPPRPRLRLVPREPRAVRPSLDGRAAYGLSHAFHLAHNELDELIAVAMRMEGRRP
jgi:hypothetical protein